MRAKSASTPQERPELVPQKPKQSVEDVFKKYYQRDSKDLPKIRSSLDDRIELARLNARMFNCSKYYVNRKDNNGKRYARPLPGSEDDNGLSEDEQLTETDNLAKQRNTNLQNFKKMYLDYDMEVPQASSDSKLDGPGEEYDNFGGRPIITRRRGEMKNPKPNAIFKAILRLPLIAIFVLIIYFLVSDPDEFLNQMRQVSA